MNMCRNIMCGLGLVFLLSACGTRSLDVATTPIQIDHAQVADPAAVRMLPVTWRVVNQDNLESFLQQMRESQSNSNAVFVAISMADYENLALNLADLVRYIQQQQAVIVYYRQITQPLPNR